MVNAFGEPIRHGAEWGFSEDRLSAGAPRSLDLDPTRADATRDQPRGVQQPVQN
jgi:hypothetical protein